MKQPKQTIGRLFLRSCYRIITGVTFCATLGLSCLLLVLFYYGRGLPDHTVLEHYEPILSNRMYYGDDHVWRDYAKERRFFTPLDLVPDKVATAFLVAEDKNFFLHPGLDLIGVFRALVKNTLAGKWRSRPMGASTITQQVAKNMLLSNERSFGRKIKEAIMALRIEKSLSKQRILELYLNQIYLGSGCYGITAAAEYYFHKNLESLSLEEIAFLAGLPKAPEAYQPSKAPHAAKARRDWVLERLYEEHIINGTEFLKASQSPIMVSHKYTKNDFDGDYFLEAARQKLIDLVGEERYTRGGYCLWTTVDPILQRIAHTTLQRGLEDYGKRYGYSGPLACIDRTTHSVDDAKELFQMYAKKISDLPKHLCLGLVLKVHENGLDVVVAHPTDKEKNTIFLPLEELQWACGKPIQSPPPLTKESLTTKEPLSISLITQAHHTSCLQRDPPFLEGDVILLRHDHDHHHTLTQIPRITGGLIVMDKNTGHVLALTGGYHFAFNQFNSVTQAFRQPGSAFKPFVYLAALERGYTKDSRILDAPISIPLGFKDKQGRTAYSPKNYSRRYYGMTTLEDGLAHSRNVMTVRLAMQIGMKPIQQTVKRLNLYDNLPRQLAMTLGAGETTLLKLTTAYAMISNGGYRVEPTFFHRIEDRHNMPLYSHSRFIHTNLQARERIASKEAIDTLQEMMTQVIQKGTGRSTLLPIAEKHTTTIFGKTGTTNDYKDAWFVGSTGSIVLGVFIGFPTPKSLGDGQTGGRVAAPIAATFFDHYLSHISRENEEDEWETPQTKDTKESDDTPSTDEDQNDISDTQGLDHLLDTLLKDTTETEEVV